LHLLQHRSSSCLHSIGRRKLDSRQEQDMSAMSQLTLKQNQDID